MDVSLIVTEGLDLADGNRVRVSAAASARLIDAATVWQEKFWLPLSETGVSIDPVRVSFTVHDSSGKAFEEAAVTLEVSRGLFIDVAVAALRYGGVATAAIMRSALSRNMYPATGRLILSAVDGVERWMAGEFAELEARASALARIQTIAMRRANHAHRLRFSEQTFGKTTTRVLTLSLPHNKKDLYAGLATARNYRRTLVQREGEMARRDRVDGATPASRAAARSQSRTRAAHYELFAGPHRAATVALMALESDLFVAFPPALAIMGEVESDLAGWIPYADAPPDRKEAMIEIEARYDMKIWRALQAHEAMLDTVEASLATASVATWSEKYFALSWDARRDADGLTGFLLAQLLADTSGAWDRLVNIATDGPIFGTLKSEKEEAAELAENHVLARLPLLAAMVEKGRAAPDVAAETLLLGAFVRDLGRAMAKKAASDKAETAAWRKVELALALGGVVVGAITLPFGAGEAVLPASFGWISTIVVGTLLVGTVVLLVRAVMGELGGLLQGDDALRDRLIGIGQTDPEALEALGDFILRRRDVAANLTRVALETLVDLAAQRTLPPLALALELRDHFEAMDDLTTGLSDLRAAK
jgi:hypothetical protein